MATWTKLRDGTWGLRVPPTAKPGDVVTVTTKDGRSEDKTVGLIVARFADAALATVGADAPPRACAPAPVRAPTPAAVPAPWAPPALPAGLALFPHQLEGCRFLVARNGRGALLADDMGLGKTCQTLLAVPLDAPVLVVCPAVAKGVWVRETKKWTPARTAAALDGRKSFRWPTAGEVLCVNFDILPKADHKNAAGFPALDPALVAAMPKGLVVVVDEAHKVKNSKAQRTQALRAIAHEARERGGRAIGLTGTPLTNKPQETYAILVALGLQFEAFGGDRSVKPFERAMTLAGGHQGRYGWEFDRGHVRPEFSQRLARVMLRRKKDEVLDLPAKRYEQLVVDVKTGDVKDADSVVAMLADRGIALDRADVAALSGSLVFEAMSKARAALAKAKISAAEELAEDCEEQGEACLFFSAHLAPVEALAKRAGWAAITGDTPNEERTRIEEAFQAGKLKGIAATIKAAGVALTLTRASRVVFIDQAWTPADNDQACDRAYRIGQTKSVLVTTLVANHDLDARIADLLAFKQDMVNATVEAARKLTIVPETVTVTTPKNELSTDDDFSELPF